jgi:hypothetical protein
MWSRAGLLHTGRACAGQLRTGQFAWKTCPRTDGSLCLSRKPGYADKSPRGFYPVRCGAGQAPWRRSVQAAAFLIVSLLNGSGAEP